MIREIVDGFGTCAERLVRAGLDGVEIVASHGYLPDHRGVDGTFISDIPISPRPRARLTDIAPSLLDLLGVDYEEWGGDASAEAEGGAA